MAKKKKKSKRDSLEFPNLDVNYNLKSRRDYLDNRHYVNGVKQDGKQVMSALDKDAKKYIDTFNKEYYNASFDDPWEYDGIHKMQVDKETVMDIKSQIKVLKKHRKKIFNKSPNTTTETDRNLANYYTGQIEEMEEFLDKVHPRRSCDNANNDRNRDLLNMAKASNEFDLVSWDTLTDDALIQAGLDDEKDEDDKY